MANYADNLRSSVVVMNDVAERIETGFNVRGSLYNSSLRSQSGSGSWALVGSTGIAVTVPAYAYVLQTFTISISQATANGELYITGAQDSTATLGPAQTLTTMYRSSTTGKDNSVTLHNIWKPGAGTFTYYIAWFTADSGIRYTSYSYNMVEVIHEITP